MRAERETIEDIEPRRAPRPWWDYAVPAALLVACGGYAWRYEILGRGVDLWYGYPLGFVISLFFGMIGLWAAKQVARGRQTPVHLNMLRVAGVYATFDAINTQTRYIVPGGFVILGAVTLVLALWMFRRQRGRAVWIGLFLFIFKVIGFMMVEATLYTLF